MSEYTSPDWRGSVEHLRERFIKAMEGIIPRGNACGRETFDRIWPSSWFAICGPAVDVCEDDTVIEVWADLPGVSEAALDVEVMENKLTIRGERPDDRDPAGRRFHASECPRGPFSRVVDLPSEVDHDNVTAVYRQGVLKVTLPKLQTARTRRVKVNIVSETPSAA